MRQVGREEMHLLLHAANHHHGLAEIRLGIARRMRQRHEHFPPKQLLFAHVILDNRIAARDAMLFAKAFKDPFCRVRCLRFRA